MREDTIAKRNKSEILLEDVAHKKTYHHFMIKEIFAQPETLQSTLDSCLRDYEILFKCFGEKAQDVFSKVGRVQIVACGTSYHAAIVAKYWLEEIAKIPCQVEVASEFYYRKAVVSPETLFVTISQSGETSDVLMALRQAKACPYVGTLAICNVPESSLVKESDLVFLTKAGKEISIASTKVFTAQLTALLMLTIILAQKQFSNHQKMEIIQVLKSLPQIVSEVLQLNDTIEKLASLFINKQHALFLGRGVHYPIAEEGALKLKEVSYVHSEAYPTGELRHGPLAFVDKKVPMIVIAPSDDALEKLKSTLKEVLAGGGQLIIFGDNASCMQDDMNIINVELPKVNQLISPIVYTVPLQLLAYHVALIKGTNVDRPRNLTKSVMGE